MSYAGTAASVAEPQEPCGLQAAGLTPTIAINPKSHNPKSDAARSEAGVKADGPNAETPGSGFYAETQNLL